MVMTAAIVLALGALDASAQPGPATPPSPAQTQQQQPQQGGMMGPGMMGRGMMGEEMTGRGMMGGRMGRAMIGGPGMMSPFTMRMMFALMDADGDGTVSLQEFQTGHERIFKAIDANKDGVLTLEEIQSFMRGTTPSSQPSGKLAPPRP
jgi:EF hand